MRTSDQVRKPSLDKHEEFDRWSWSVFRWSVNSMLSLLSYIYQIALKIVRIFEWNSSICYVLFLTTWKHNLIITVIQNPPVAILHCKWKLQRKATYNDYLMANGKRSEKPTILSHSKIWGIPDQSICNLKFQLMDPEKCNRIRFRTFYVYLT